MSWHEIRSSRIPAAFSGFRIVQVSDLHNAEFGEDNAKLVELISQTDPDLIVLTGDLVDSWVTNIQVALNFATETVKIAPVYYVPGNHEVRISQYDDLKTGLGKASGTILDNKAVPIIREGESITLMGVTDSSYETDYLFGDTELVFSNQLATISNESGTYRILLAHRPELFEYYASVGMDLYSVATPMAVRSGYRSLVVW